MQAGQRLVASDGYEVALFPLPYMNISQGELMPSGWSHYNVYNIDFLGWNANGRVNQAPIYAPCTMKVVNYWGTYDGGHQVFFESTRPVHLANGQLDYLTIYFAHDSNPPYTTIGQVVNQGDLCYHTGTYGEVTGDHVHTCCGQGQYIGVTQRTGGHYDLTNRIHYYDGVYVNDTTIIDGNNYDWKTWSGPTPPPPSPTPIRDKFPWVLYARKLREGRWM